MKSPNILKKSELSYDNAHHLMKNLVDHLYLPANEIAFSQLRSKIRLLLEIALLPKVPQWLNKIYPYVTKETRTREKVESILEMNEDELNYLIGIKEQEKVISIARVKDTQLKNEKEQIILEICNISRDPHYKNSKLGEKTIHKTIESIKESQPNAAIIIQSKNEHILELFKEMGAKLIDFDCNTALGKKLRLGLDNNVKWENYYPKMIEAGFKIIYLEKIK